MTFVEYLAVLLIKLSCNTFSYLYHLCIQLDIKEMKNEVMKNC